MLSGGGKFRKRKTMTADPTPPKRKKEDTGDQILEPIASKDVKIKAPKEIPKAEKLDPKIEAVSQKKFNKQRNKINQLRVEKKIKVHGTDVPDPLTSFQQLDNVYHLKKHLVDNVLESGYTEPTPIQMQSIPIMLAVDMGIYYADAAGKRHSRNRSDWFWKDCSVYYSHPIQPQRKSVDQFG